MKYALNSSKSHRLENPKQQNESKEHNPIKAIMYQTQILIFKKSKRFDVITLTVASWSWMTSFAWLDKL